jgi:putative NADH-flavin reductase
MHITVFGASGRVGQLVVARLLGEGHTVTAFVHSRNPFEGQPVTVVQGEIDDSTAVARALSGSDAVISTLGSWGTKNKNILTTGMQTIIPLMEEQGIIRIITLTGSDAQWSQDKLNSINKLSHAILGLIAPKILADGETHLRLLEASSLDWTTVRSPTMTSSSSDTYTLRLKARSPLAWIPRAAVVKALVDQLQDPSFIRQAPIIY